MKAYDAFSSWATLNMVDLQGEPDPVLSGTGPAPGSAHRPAARQRGRETDRRPDGLNVEAGLGPGDEARPRDTRGFAPHWPGTGPAGTTNGSPFRSHLLSFGFVVGLVLVDVVVEGAAGVGHEHVVER